MKEYKKVTIICFIMTLAFAAILAVNSVAGKQNEAPLRAKIVFPPDEDKVYNLDNPKEAISLDLLLKNVSGSKVWTQEGFDDQNLHLFLFLYGPLGKDARLITSASSKLGGSSTPSVAPDKMAVEELNSKMPPDFKDSPWAKKISIKELRDYYNLTRPGEYKLWFAMSFVQYDPANLEVVEENKNDKKIRYYVPFNDRIWSGVIEFKEEYITLKTSTPVIKSDIRAKAKEYILSKRFHSGVTTSPSGKDDFVLKLYSRSACEAIYGTFNIKTLSAIANDVQLNSEALVAKPVYLDKREYIFRDVKQDDCIVIGNVAYGVSGYKYLWGFIRAADTRWGTKEIYINLELLTEDRRKAVIDKSQK